MHPVLVQSSVPVNSASAVLLLVNTQQSLPQWASLLPASHM